MSAVATGHSCRHCGKRFERPGLSDFVYGEFVMEVDDLEDARYLNSFADAVFDEVSRLVDSNLQVSGRNDRERAKIFHGIFGEVCDRSSRGELLSLDFHPKCPACGSPDTDAWGVVTPVRGWPLPPVTHESWNAKTAGEKQTIIDEAIRAYLDAHR